MTRPTAIIRLYEIIQFDWWWIFFTRGTSISCERKFLKQSWLPIGPCFKTYYLVVSTYNWWKTCSEVDMTCSSTFLKDFIVTNFCFKNFSEIYSGIVDINNENWLPGNFRQKYQQIFHQTRFSSKSCVHLFRKKYSSPAKLNYRILLPIESRFIAWAAISVV